MITPEIVESKCQPFLNAFTQSFHVGIRRTLRRGLLIQAPDDFTRLTVNKNRKPFNTTERVHNITDDWFDEKFGIRARSQSIFCSTKMEVVKEYGFPFLVFPEGEFHVIHSDKVDDLFLHLTNTDILKQYNKMHPDNTQENSSFSEVSRFISNLDESTLKAAIYGIMDTLQYRKDDFSGALSSKNEIMVYCDHYYVSPDDGSSTEGLALLKKYALSQHM